MDDAQEARFRAFYGRMESDEIIRLLKYGAVSAPGAALAVLAQRGVSDPSLERREKKRDDDVDGGNDGDSDGGLIQMGLDFLSGLDFDFGD